MWEYPAGIGCLNIDSTEILSNRKRILIFQGMDTLDAFEIISIAAGLVGVYVKLTQEVHKLKSRIIALEKTETEVKGMLTELLSSVQEIKILLAQQGIR